MILLLAAFFLVIFGGLAAAIAVLAGRGETVAVPGSGDAALAGGPLGEAESEDGAANLLREDRVSAIGFWDELLQRFYFATDLKKLLAEAGLNWSVGRLTLMMLLAGAMVAATLSRLSWIPVWLAIAIGCGAGMIPYFRVFGMRQKRLDKFEQGFPDALDSLTRALRAGHPLSAGMEVLAAEAAAPVSTEFRRTLDEWRLGRSWDQALEHLAQRIPLVNVRIFVAAVKLQSKTGGRLTDVLSKLSDTIRESNALEGEIQAISAHGRLTGLILTMLPIGISIMMMWVNPSYLTSLVVHPMGKFLVGGAIFCLIAAHFVIRKILDIKL
jgi:tight adherence protein B